MPLEQRPDNTCKRTVCPSHTGSISEGTIRSLESQTLSAPNLAGSHTAMYSFSWRTPNLGGCVNQNSALLSPHDKALPPPALGQRDTIGRMTAGSIGPQTLPCMTGARLAPWSGTQSFLALFVTLRRQQRSKHCHMAGKETNEREQQRCAKKGPGITVEQLHRIFASRLGEQ